MPEKRLVRGVRKDSLQVMHGCIRHTCLNTDTDQCHLVVLLWQPEVLEDARAAVGACGSALLKQPACSQRACVR
jgi:hypothetical protein